MPVVMSECFRVERGGEYMISLEVMLAHMFRGTLWHGSHEDRDRHSVGPNCLYSTVDFFPSLF